MMESVDDRPRFSPEDAASVAREFFGLEARAEELPSERDRNFKLTSGEGRSFVLKIAHHLAPISSLDLQNQAMDIVESMTPTWSAFR